MNSESEDLSDAEYAAVIVSICRNRVIRLRPNHFAIWDDVDFHRRFRLSKQTALIILDQIAPNIQNTTNRNNALSAESMFLLTLRFYASGGMLITSGDFCGVSKSSASKVVKKVSHHIAMLRSKYIKFPNNTAEIQKAVLDFYKIAKFRRVIGALDCTHVKIQSPGGQTGEVYRNRKGYFSLNVQAMCNSKLQVLDVVARWPGSCHDSTIFHNSRICARLESGEFGDKVIVADGGYPCKSYMMTPLRTCSTAAQSLYNEAQISTRNPVERLFGVWKRRFPVLAMGLRLKLKTIQRVIIATAILHNVCCLHNELQPPPLDDLIEEQVEYTLQTDHQLNSTADVGTHREALIEYFRYMTENLEIEVD